MKRQLPGKRLGLALARRVALLGLKHAAQLLAELGGIRVAVALDPPD